MSRLIDADTLTEEVNRLPAADIKNIDGQAYVLVRLSQVFNVIKTQPTVDPVTHGRWIDKYGDGNWHCTRCGAIVEKHEQDYRNWYFCYHCGARMDGDKNE